MKSKFVKRNSLNRLIIIYAGLGMDWRPFANLDHPDYDILVIWDYRELTFNWRPFFRYDEICLIAWSVGVFAATVTIHEILPRITLRIAINGTLNPIDENNGISPAVWHGLQNVLSPSAWRRFQQRMCMSESQYYDFFETSSKRTLFEIAEELDALESHTVFHVEQISDWDMAIIGRYDIIMPPESQIRAWKDLVPIRMLDTGHLPDFQQIIHRLVIDKNLIARRYSKLKDTKDSEEYRTHIARTLMSRFDSVFGNGRIIGNIIEIGCGKNGILSKQWIDRTDPRAKIQLWDLVDIPENNLPANCVFEQCDAEVRIRRQPSGSAGFIFSSLTIHWFNSLREFFKECERVLVPDGILAVSSYRLGNLEELTSITGNGLQLPTLRGWQKLIPSGLEILVCEEGEIKKSFDEPRLGLEFLRSLGANMIRFGQSPYTIAKKVIKQYPRNPRTGKYDATFRPIYIIARKTAE